MKVHIGKYKDWVGPYQLAEKILFWMNKDEDDRVHNFGEWLCRGWFTEDSLLLKVMRLLHSDKRKIKVKIDAYDTWSMDSTLALIALPMLIHLKETKHGAPDVEDTDVPDDLKSTNADPQTEEEIANFHADSNHFKRWDWVLDEMIFAFTSKNIDWEEQFSSGDMDWFFKEIDHNGTKMYEMKDGPNHTYKVDWDGRNAYQARITNGFRLFGKYYEGLWS